MTKLELEKDELLIILIAMKAYCMIAESVLALDDEAFERLSTKLTEARHAKGE